MKTIFEKYFKGDPVIWILVFLLSLFSLLAVYSSTGTLAYKNHGGNTLFYLGKHTALILIGIGVIWIVHWTPYKLYLRLASILLYVSIGLLILTLLIGTDLNQASRWLTLPIVGFSIQTSEIAKMSMILYIAKVLSKNQSTQEKRKKAFKNIIIHLIIVSLLIVTQNLSTTIILFGLSLIIMYLGRIPFKYIAGVIGIGSFCIIFLIFIGSYFGIERAQTWENRITSYYTENGDLRGSNFQKEQAKIAVASGGILWGKGPGNSDQKNFLPHPYSDFIYAIIIEEYGILIGGILILAIYMWLLYRALIIVRKSTKTFQTFATLGLTLGIVIQALVHIGVNVSILPVTGQTLPLISMGGSSILVVSLNIGILLSVTRDIEKDTKKEQKEQKEQTNEEQETEA